MKHWLPVLSITATGLLTNSIAANADDLAFAIMEDTLIANYETNFDAASIQYSLLHTNADDVKNSRTNNIAVSNTKVDGITSDVLGAALFANGKSGSIRSRLGGKVFYIDTEGGDSMHGLALGGGADVYVGPNIFFSLDALYSPDIVTGGDFNHYQDINAQATFQVMKSASVFLGYRDVQVDFESDKKRTREIFSGPFFGFHFRF